MKCAVTRLKALCDCIGADERPSLHTCARVDHNLRQASHMHASDLSG
jgi:hypothetical protein